MEEGTRTINKKRTANYVKWEIYPKNIHAKNGKITK